MQVIPSILVENVADLKIQIDKLIPFYKRFQIDFADGHFVPHATAPIMDLVESLLPYKELEFDLHLMTSDYHKALDHVEKHKNSIKFDIIFIHHRANPDPKLFLEGAQSRSMGLVLNPEDSVDTIKHIYSLPHLNNVQIMTVIPGSQGSAFIPISLNKIDQLRDAGYRKNIFLDGGINKDSLEIITQRKNHPDFVCPGSFFSRAENLEERVQYLSEVLKDENNTNQNAQDHQ